jgi:hypothetical protein
MRDFRDAKVMARALRDALKARSVETSHSDCLELIAKTFGLENWNVLAPRIEAAQTADASKLSVTADSQAAMLHCSFCGKSQNDVRKLIAGPKVLICDQCVGLCDDILEDESIFDLFAGDEDTTAVSAAKLARARLHAGSWRVTLDEIRRNLSARQDGAANAFSTPQASHFQRKSTDELMALEKRYQRALARYEAAERGAPSSIHE